MNIVILAAGKGTRMKSDLPKVLHAIGGMPMLGHVLQTSSALQPSRLIVVIGHGAEKVKQVFSETTRGQISLGLPGLSLTPSIQWVVQDPPLGTGHAMQQTISVLDPDVPTLILYGDVPLITVQTLESLAAAARAHQGMAILTADLPNPSGYGRILRDATGKITQVVEEKDATAAIREICEINTGTMIAPTPQLMKWLSQLQNNNAQKEFYLTDIVAMAVAQGLTIGSAQPARADEVLGINSQAQRAEVERIFQRRLAETAMAQGVCLADPARFDVRGQLECEADVSIDINCVFEGHVVLGNGARVGPHCVIKNSRIGAGAKIEAFSHIDQSDVGAAAVVGPYARLRPGTNLGEGSHVGNFVEMKNSTLGAFSKANHLSYLGDATIGKRVNIGAGTITCNYDGAEKHRTTIEDDAFIGSDSQLVAPVTVGRGATLGAGTTLRQDAPADQLTVSRSQQVSIARYKRPKKKAH